MPARRSEADLASPVDRMLNRGGVGCRTDTEVPVAPCVAGGGARSPVVAALGRGQRARPLLSTLLTGAALATGCAVYASFNTSTANVTPPVYASLAAPAAGQTVVSVRYLLARRARAARRGVQQPSPRLLPVLAP